MKTSQAVCSIAAGAAMCAAVANAQLGTVWSPRTLNEYLARDYYVQAKREADHSLDIKDSAIMMERSAEALRGHRVMPVPLDGVKYVGATPAELADGRARLMRVLRNDNIVSQRTEAVSHAQVMFDCWAVQQQAGPNASHNLYQCKDRFLRTIAMLDPGPQAAPMPVKWRIVKAYDVYFDWDKSTIRADAASTLNEVKAMLADPANSTKRIAIGGHADASGPVGYNQRLSERRVRAVADYLNVTPLTADEIDLRAYGETNLPVPTSDGVRLQANRVAKVAVVEVEE